MRGIPVSQLTLSSVLLLAACGGGGGGPGGGPPPPTFDLYVSATAGSDANPGTLALPLKTLTAALALAASNGSVKLAPGTYDLANGETFPLALPPGVSVEGDIQNRGDGPTATLVNGAAAIAHPFLTHASIVANEGCALRGLKLNTVTGSDVRTAVLVQGVTAEIAECTLAAPAYMGVYLSGSGTSEVHHCTFESGSYGVYFGGPTGAVSVHDCTFVDPLFGVDAGTALLAQILNNQFLGSAIVGVHVQGGTPLLQGNTFSGTAYSTGAVLIQGGKPVLRSNTFTGNQGVHINPSGDADLGTAASSGLNSFAAVTGYGLEHTGPLTIQAQGNTWQHAPPTAGTDIVVTGAGKVIYGPGVNDHVP